VPTKSVVPSSRRNRANCFILSDIGAEDALQPLLHKKTTPPRSANTTERECVGVVWAVIKLRHFLDGQRFLIRTDHQALGWIYSTTDSRGRLMRWRLRHSEYTFDMVYKPGASHHLPDFLSRTSTVTPPEDIYDDIPCLAFAETASGLRTGRYTGIDTPEPMEFDDVVEEQ